MDRANTLSDVVGTMPPGERRPTSESIPVLRPLLPTAERLLPYLRRIDAARVYTNWGPLASELESRLAGLFATGAHSVVSASSGTAALVGAILATAGRATSNRPLAIVPAFTFVATASAVEQCGYTPFLADVQADSWMLDPVVPVGPDLLNRVGLVVPVSPFGRGVPQDPWLTFRDRTGIPVVIDGAASFAAIQDDPRANTGAIPVALSFHATKSFGSGEGGAVITTDDAAAEAVIRALNFGFLGSRSAESANSNGKMSEYHAAVGLAELDGWGAKRGRLDALAGRYRERFQQAGLSQRLTASPSVAGCYVLFECADVAETRRVTDALGQGQIEFRFWYGGGLLEHPYYGGLAHAPLPVTASISGRLVGLPIAADLTDTELDRIVATVAYAIRRELR